MPVLDGMGADGGGYALRLRPGKGSALPNSLAVDVQHPLFRGFVMKKRCSTSTTNSIGVYSSFKRNTL